MCINCVRKLFKKKHWPIFGRVEFSKGSKKYFYYFILWRLYVSIGPSRWFIPRLILNRCSWSVLAGPFDICWQRS